MFHNDWPRDVRLAVPAGALSIAGDAMAMVALTLRVHATGEGPYAVAVLLACFALPVVLTMGVAGSLADRADPRVVLGVGGGVQAVAAVGLACWHSVPATLALGGVAASVLGPRPSFVVAGTLGLAVAGWAWWSLARVGTLSGARP